MKTLLEIAKASKPTTRKNQIPLNGEVVDISIAWAKGEVSYAQVLDAFFGARNGTLQAYSYLARGLREAVKKGKLIAR